MVRSVEERLATLEAENDAAKPMHAQFQADISELKVGVAKIQTTMEILVTNGHQKWSERAKASIVPLGSGGGLMGLAWLLLEKL